MRKTVLASLLAFPLVLSLACASGGSSSSSSQPGHGAITVTVAPNPIVAQRAGSGYEFPFDVVIRETGGHSVEISRVTADVIALGGLRVASESYDAAKIRSLGYSTHVPANGELRYHFSPRVGVEDDRLFSGVSADLQIDGTDESGFAVRASTRVTVTR
jgi:hypothetical protein